MRDQIGLVEVGVVVGQAARALGGLQEAQAQVPGLRSRQRGVAVGAALARR